jgi:RNA polymerase sigma-70 factor (ECF subfamily)
MSDRLDNEICEKKLLDGLRRGDPVSQELLVRHYGPRVLATANRYMRDPDDAADVFQEAFIKIFKGIERFEGRSSLFHWMRSITIRVALTQLRRQSKRAEVPFEAWHQQENSEAHLSTALCCETEQQAEADEVQLHVRAAVDSLPDRHRSIILLRDLIGASPREAADTLGIETNAANVRLHRARRALRDSLNGRIDPRDLGNWQAETPSAIINEPVAAAAT